MENKFDIVKNIIFGVIRICLTFVWWVAMLFLASLVLTSIWRVSWEQLLIYAGVLTVITVIGYVIYKIFSPKEKRRREAYRKLNE